MPDAFPSPRSRLRDLWPCVRTYLDLTQPHRRGGDTEAALIVREWPLDDGAILLTSQGVLLALDSAAYRIWRLDSEGLDLSELVQRMAADWDVAVRDAEPGCTHVLERLKLSGCRPRGAQ